MAKKKPARARTPAVGKRERSIQQRTLDTKSKIVESAIEAFAAFGYEGSSTRSIAARAGLQHALVTYHFQNKEGLWRQVIASILSGYKKTFDARIEGLRGVDDVVKLKLIHEDFIRFSAQNINFHRIMAHVASKPSPQLDWLIEAYLRHTFDERARLIRSAQRAGLYVEGDPYHLEYVFIGAVTRVFLLAAEVEKIVGQSPLDPKFVEKHLRICLNLFFREPSQRVRRRSRRAVHT